ncbi:hypothetical protein ABK046_51965, partial [Streptomyces caeruleatus]
MISLFCNNYQAIHFAGNQSNSWDHPISITFDMVTQEDSWIRWTIRIDHLLEVCCTCIIFSKRC